MMFTYLRNTDGGIYAIETDGFSFAVDDAELSPDEFELLAVQLSASSFGDDDADSYEFTDEQILEISRRLEELGRKDEH